jgi:putative aminopeptidase FrvX
VRTAAEESASTDNRGIILETSESADGAVLAMWDVPTFQVREDLLHARVCDDLAGVAAILAALDRLAHRDDPVDVAAIFSRAEEAGFCGVLCLLAEEQLHPLLSEDGIYISVENSSERPGVTCGDGAIIRLGDRATTFDGPTADLLWRVGREAGIKTKRMLMDGGTCEATVFARKGLRASGLCIPLRHYHNMDRSTGRIAPEVISISDAEAVTSLIEGFTIHHNNPSRLGPEMDFDLFLRKGLEHLTRPDVAGVPKA